MRHAAVHINVAIAHVPIETSKKFVATIAAMEHVKDKCTKDTPCKYRVEDRGPVSVVTVEFTRKDSPDAPPKAYPGGRAQLTIDKKGNLVKRVDG